MRNQMQGKHANGSIGEGTKSHKPEPKKLREKRRYNFLNWLAFIGPSLLLYKVCGPYVVTLFFKHSYLSYMWHGLQLRMDHKKIYVTMRILSGLKYKHYFRSNG